MIIDIQEIAINLLPVFGVSFACQKELTLLTQLVYGEARNQTEEGKKAVAFVAINRWQKGRHPYSLRDIILKPYQFSCFNRNDVNYEKIQEIPISELPVWESCVKAAISVYMGFVPDNTNGAVFYLTKNCFLYNKPNWNWSEVQETTIIGDHVFFKQI